MEKSTVKPTSWRKKAGNILFYALLLFFVFSTDAKSWVLRQLVSVGVFHAEIKKEAPAGKAPATAFSLTGTDGRTLSTADLRGKVVFINFWATWCPPCRAEMPSLQALYQQLKDDDRLVFLFISEDENEATAKDYLKRQGLELPLFRRSGGIPPGIFSGTLPTTVVLDTHGSVAFRREGLAGYHTDAFIRQLKELASTNENDNHDKRK